MEGRRGRRRKQLEIEKGSTRSRCAQNRLSKMLRTCPKTDYVVVVVAAAAATKKSVHAFCYSTEHKSKL
jgi:ABC-type branched-subunit amino acid transport system substrate-binding protein